MSVGFYDWLWNRHKLDCYTYDSMDYIYRVSYIANYRDYLAEQGIFVYT